MSAFLACLGGARLRVSAARGRPGLPSGSLPPMSGWGDLFKDKYEERIDESTGETIMVHARSARTPVHARHSAVDALPYAGGEGHEAPQAGRAGQHSRSRRCSRAEPLCRRVRWRRRQQRRQRRLPIRRSSGWRRRRLHVWWCALLRRQRRLPVWRCARQQRRRVHVWWRRSCSGQRRRWFCLWRRRGSARSSTSGGGDGDGTVQAPRGGGAGLSRQARPHQRARADGERERRAADRRKRGLRATGIWRRGQARQREAAAAADRGGADLPGGVGPG